MRAFRWYRCTMCHFRDFLPGPHRPVRSHRCPHCHLRTTFEQD